MKILHVSPLRSRGLRACFIVIAALAATALARAAEPAPAPPSAPQPDNGYSGLAHADSAFLVRAARANAEALAIARIAASRATHSPVGGFAAELVAAHEAADVALARLATAKTVNLGIVSQDEINRKWSDQPAAEFDKFFLLEVIAAHRRATVLHENASLDTKDRDVAEFARDQLADVKDRLVKAEELAKSLE